MRETQIWPGWDTVRIIGSGGFGKVYEIRKAEDSETGDYRSALKAAVLKALAFDPAERFSDSEEFWEALQNCRRMLEQDVYAGTDTCGEDTATQGIWNDTSSLIANGKVVHDFEKKK